MSTIKPNSSQSGRSEAHQNALTPSASPSTSSPLPMRPVPPALSSWLLVLLVFCGGATSLAVEMAASRLLAPDFGSSLFVWASLIGLILLYLTLGYYIGGRVADRAPRRSIFYSLALLAALLVAVIPLLSAPVLSWALNTFAAGPLGAFYGSLAAILVLFTLPMILLGCISPFAIRLQVKQVGSSGRTAGYLYAISTAGSILGTFLPVLVLLPDIGTARTFLVFAATLLLVSLLGLLSEYMHTSLASGA
jgi:predicted membrane-bound spermidine synthase